MNDGSKDNSGEIIKVCQEVSGKNKSFYQRKRRLK
jgi:hypothetical protein